MQVEAINYLAQEDENNLQQQQTLIESRQQESTRDKGVKKFYDMGSVKWMSSKMRLMRKMMSSGQTMVSSPTNYNSSMPRTHLDSPQSSSDEDDDDHSSSSSLTSNIRVCSDCNTTKTPLWRSGPKGPKVWIQQLQSHFLKLYYFLCTSSIFTSTTIVFSLIKLFLFCV